MNLKDRVLSNLKDIRGHSRDLTMAVSYGALVLGGALANTFYTRPATVLNGELMTGEYAQVLDDNKKFGSREYALAIENDEWYTNHFSNKPNCIKLLEIDKIEGRVGSYHAPLPDNFKLEGSYVVEFCTGIQATILNGKLVGIYKPHHSTQKPPT